ncbi:hypothetical protein [Neobacillus kokaensis]|uniref:Uncharacterized protein n=1 Tax=Neobacillus kokaensis TaxID=2759023 RepID=A0ABQ3NAZ0_9BACI|nr:hypothetical protein [Neobacillus kokaensis]GHI01080.1 hypothetical protein AM1BK_46220 [Neobacillus kokaensis]
MAQDVTDLLGAPYENIIEAKVDKSPSEVVISNDGGETYYIVEREVYEDSLKQLGYEVAVSDGE